jgi:4-alpha-glucanotransferase
MKKKCTVMKVQFFLRFHTEFGQTLWINGSVAELGGGDLTQSYPMTYLNDEFWMATLDIDRKEDSVFSYRYILKNKDGELTPECGNDRLAEDGKASITELHFIDTWNHAGEYENAFFSAPFQNILLKANQSKCKTEEPKNPTHIFKVKAPLLQKNEAVCISGSDAELGNWSKKEPSLLTREGNWWVLRVNLNKASFPFSYKYGVYDTKAEKFSRYEDGDNRFLYAEASKKKLITIHDGFIHLPNNTWKGAGIAIPVFSLRSQKSFGVGEFTDIKLLVDWAKETGLKLVQILPVNDTTATHSWVDSYPYAAISAFALHPIFINLEKVAGKKFADKIQVLNNKQEQLNALAEIDYEQVMKFKWEMLSELFDLQKDKCFESDDYKDFFEKNKHWLVPYAGFCFLRDKYNTSEFSNWPSNSVYNKATIESLSAPGSEACNSIMLQYFVQYQLHLQLKDAVDYAHKNGIVLKGDIPIGIYRNGCDAWVEPSLYNMDQQAGAPPDDFAIKGQNWGFPTYNWKKMQEDGFAWWRQRFEQMSNYFDAFRIDHILGFFRIWSIPMHAVEGILGHFVPSIPVVITEFGEKGLWFDHHRYCKPYIVESVLDEIFGHLKDKVKAEFITANDFGSYDLRPEFETQRQVEAHFNLLEKNEENEKLKYGLFDLISNIILIEEEGTQGQKFHFRIAMENTISFHHLDDDTRRKLKELYINYFFRRQDAFWMKEAMHKLPYLKASTNMLICGEDLGMVPDCVPDVMKQLGILSLEIQRMPKDPKQEFFNPAWAPYMSVVTPSTHDMSTIRGWWEEDRGRIQRFYNNQMGQSGSAPYFCEAWINRAIVLQHLYSPAMWSIFQLQDILGMSETIRRQNPNEERINIPADPKHYWRYRMHILLEDLLNETAFNDELKGYVQHSGRA